MDCRLVAERDLLEEYVLDRLAEPEREALERHVFECDDCLHQLQTLHALRQELASQRDAILNRPAQPRSRWYWQAAAAAAIVALGVGLAVWRTPRTSSRAARVEPTPAPAAPRGPAAPSARQPTAGGTQASAPAAAARGDLVALAAIEPPPYLPLTVRGDADAALFDRAMRDYAAGDYAAAARRLDRAAAARPNDLPTNFFLGVSLLMIDDADGAAARLRHTVALGDSPFRQLADLFLAKALIRRGDLDGARRELLRTSRLPGSHAAEARALLQQLGSTGSPAR